MDRRFKIMLIDDDLKIHGVMRKILESEGYDFVSAFDGYSGLEELAKERPDLLLLDVMMPGLDGYEVCRRIRAKGRRVPVFFLTAKGDIVDKRTGYAAGGDDYVVKPFDTEELLLRIGATLRRRADDVARKKTQQLGSHICIGDLELFCERYEAYLGGERLDLTAKEFEVVALLASHPGEVFNRGQIFTHLWGKDVPVDEGSITVFVHKIREKLHEDPTNPKYLLTVWRVGYKFANRV